MVTLRFNKKLTTLFILMSLFSCWAFAQESVILLTKNDPISSRVAYFDKQGFFDILSGKDVSNSEELTGKLSDYLISTPMAMADSFKNQQLPPNFLFVEIPTFWVTEPVGQNFYYAYLQFMNVEVEKLSRTIMRVFDASTMTDMATAFEVRVKFYRCIHASAISETVPDCLAPLRPHLTKDSVVLTEFISSYSKLFRMSRFIFEVPFEFNADSAYVDQMCLRIQKNYKKIQAARDAIVTNVIQQNRFNRDATTGILVNLLPDMSTVTGAKFSSRNTRSYNDGGFNCPVANGRGS